jgi:hypothetical protein
LLWSAFFPEFKRNQKFYFRESFIFSLRIFRKNETWISQKLSRKNESENFRSNPTPVHFPLIFTPLWVT